MENDRLLKDQIIALNINTQKNDLIILSIVDYFKKNYIM